ncbi:hypothetical protein LR48_Vigan10g078000 [Vigna angularis]|uniref:Uncharacterized protein n=1 Tax=Phaseolus angularis TaxID=3914 RepID=A0A0L9VIR8_PHAAN|nr:uncharacterized protein LOC128193795 [Vigna angularis]KOM54888.1 hypothetical protein LR48_Vigan10g078000 [Vigna angularis]
MWQSRHSNRTNTKPPHSNRTTTKPSSQSHPNLNTESQKQNPSRCDYHAHHHQHASFFIRQPWQPKAPSPPSSLATVLSNASSTPKPSLHNHHLAPSSSPTKPPQRRHITPSPRPKIAEASSLTHVDHHREVAINTSSSSKLVSDHHHEQRLFFIHAQPWPSSIDASCRHPHHLHSEKSKDQQPSHTQRPNSKKPFEL